MIFIYTDFSDLKEARKISQLLLKKRLAACVNFFPVESMYWWKKKLVKDREVACIIKTPKKNYKKIENLIKKNHSYKVPCILELPINRSYKPYAQWLNKETR